MEIEAVYENIEHEDSFGSKTQNHRQTKAKKCGGRRCLVVITVSLGLICVLLLIFIILQHITITAERDLTKKKGKRVLSLSDELKKAASIGGWFFMFNEEKNWSDSRQYCRDLGGDLVIINTEEKQSVISSFSTDVVWIGLSDAESEGNMKWVDNSQLKQGFWIKGEPNNLNGGEDCVELIPGLSVLNNWNDLPCSFTNKLICET